MKKLKIGVLGCADIAKRMLVPNMIASNRFEVAAFASRNIEKANEFSNIFGGKAILGYEKLLELDDIDVV